jgi:hypothetical protein
MILKNGYDILNFIMKDKSFQINESVFISVLNFIGFDIKYDYNDEYNNKLVSKNVIMDILGFEKLILDFRIWKKASLETQKNLFIFLNYLLTEHPQHDHHINLFR